MSLTSDLTEVRYYTQTDAYYYTVDNRPLGDLADRDEQISGAIDLMLRADTIIGFDATNLVDGATVIFKGRSAVNDGGGGVFSYDADSVQTADNGLVFAPTGGGRLFRSGWTTFGFRGNIIVEWFGAKADWTGGAPGSATNNYTAIQAAINAAADTGFGGVVELSHGEYRINTGLVIPGSSLVKLVGKGLDSTSLRYYDSGVALSMVGTGIDQVQKSAVIGIAIYNSGTTGTIGVSMEYCVYSKVEDVRCYGFTTGLKIQNSWNDDLIRVVCDFNSEDGFLFTSVDANAISLYSCQGVGNGRAGLHINGGRGVHSYNGTWEANDEYGVLLSGGATWRPLNVRIWGGYIEGNGTWEIFFDSSTGYVVYGASIKGVYFECMPSKATKAIVINDAVNVDIDECVFDNQSGTNYDHSLHVPAGGTKSKIKWGENSTDRSTSGILIASPIVDVSRQTVVASAKFNGVGSVTIAKSVGIDTITRISAGIYEITLSEEMGDTEYTVQVNAENGSSYSFMVANWIPNSLTTSVFRVATGRLDGVAADARSVMITVTRG